MIGLGPPSLRDETNPARVTSPRPAAACPGQRTRWPERACRKYDGTARSDLSSESDARYLIAQEGRLQNQVQRFSDWDVRRTRVDCIGGEACLCISMHLFEEGLRVVLLSAKSPWRSIEYSFSSSSGRECGPCVVT